MNLESKKNFGLFLAALQPIFEKSGKPDFRIRMNRDGSEKKIIYIKPYKSFNCCFINFLVRPLLLGAPLLIVPTFTKGAPRRSGRTKKFINNQLQLIYDI